MRASLLVGGEKLSMGRGGAGPDPQLEGEGSCRNQGALGAPACWPPRSVWVPPPLTELQVVRVPGAREEMARRSGARCPDPVCALGGVLANV